MSRNRARRVLRTCGAALAVVLCWQLSTSAAEGPYPGLPAGDPANGGWAGVAQTGMAETARARQWVRVPLHVATSWTYVLATDESDPEISGKNGLSNAIQFVSETGAEDNYGHMPPLTVRTVAFGAIPVEATVQVSQRRNADNEPIPIRLMVYDVYYRNGITEYLDSRVQEEVDLRITKLKIDGQDIGLRGRCKTVRRAALDLLGNGYTVENRAELTEFENNLDWTKHFNPARAGGRLEGTMDIPAFTDCVTNSGDDLSRVLTSTVSGPDNEVKLQITGPVCQAWVEGRAAPPAPGQSTPEAAQCLTLPPEIPYPTE